MGSKIVSLPQGIGHFCLLPANGVGLWDLSFEKVIPSGCLIHLMEMGTKVMITDI